MGDDKEARFNHALDMVLQDEGSYADDRDDPGGATKFGITQKDLDTWSSKLGLPSEVMSLSRDNAATFYKIVWWNKYNYNAINSIDIASKVFDLAVNIGPVNAVRLLQKSLNWLGYGLEVDGVLDPKTIFSTNETCLHGRENDLHDELREEAITYYEEITEENPKLYKFLKGWIRRAKE